MQVKKFLEDKIVQDFDFEVEHWDNGNFDDSHSYGVDCGEQYAYREILEKISVLLV